MSKNLPLNADEIAISWVRHDVGGVCLTAMTDAAAIPYIGVYLLDGQERPLGLPVRVQRDYLCDKLVVGFAHGQPISIHVDATIHTRGLTGTVKVPLDLQNGLEAVRYLSAKWGDPAPRYRFLLGNTGSTAL